MDLSIISFAKLAKSLINEHTICVCTNHGDCEYRICEVEMYLHNAIHPDPYTHCSAEQLQPGIIYFHANGTFKAGTYKGMDLTFGTPGTAFGVLIRAIRAPCGRIIYGPSNVVSEILQHFGAQEVKEINHLLPFKFNISDTLSEITGADRVLPQAEC